MCGGGIISKSSSECIYRVKFMCVLVVVFMHSSTAHLVSAEYSSVINYIYKLLANYATINILLFLSAYFFFFKVKDLSVSIYKSKLIRRISTLLIPYLIWCVFGFLFNYLIGDFEYTSTLSFIKRIFWGDPIITGHPSGRALWFIRNLIVFALISPLYFYVVKIFKHFTLFFVLLFSIENFGVQYDFPFFNAYLLFGVYLAYYEISFERIYKFTGYIVPIILMLLISVANTLIGYFTHPDVVTTCIFFLAIYGICDKIHFSNTLVATSTFLYMSHMYITSIMRNLLIRIFPNSLFFSVAACFITWLVSIILCVLCYIFLKKHAPKVLSYITGGRI